MALCGRSSFTQVGVLCSLAVFVLLVHFLSSPPPRYQQYTPQTQSQPSAQEDWRNLPTATAGAEALSTLPPSLPSMARPADIALPYVDHSVHFAQVLLILSPDHDLSARRRHILRRLLLGLPNNLLPCMRANGNLLYKFLVPRPDPLIASPKSLRDLVVEQVQHGDVVEMDLKEDTPSHPDVTRHPWAMQAAALRWIEATNITYDNLILSDVYTYIRLDLYQNELAEGKVAGRVIAPAHPSNLILGDFGDRRPSFFILGPTALSAVLAHIDDVTDPIPGTTPITQYQASLPADPTHVQLVSDARIHRWPNTLIHVPKHSSALTRVFLEDEYRDLSLHLPPTSHPLICRRPATDLNAALITRSFISQSEKCDLANGAALRAGLDLRAWAAKRGYALVPRSGEFDQQEKKGRREGWGVIDSVEKVLPRYDWVMWVGPQALIVDPEWRLEKALAAWAAALGPEEFAKKGLFISDVGADTDGGISFWRNSEWTRKFLRELQSRRGLWETGGMVKNAIWEVLGDPAWSSGVHILQGDLAISAKPGPDGHLLPPPIVDFTGSKACPQREIIRTLDQMSAGIPQTEIRTA